MTTSSVLHARRALLCVGPRSLTIERTSCLPPRCCYSDIPHRSYERLVGAVVTCPAALIAARDSLCANSMALGGRAGNDSCKRGGVASRLVQIHHFFLEAHTDKDIAATLVALYTT